MASENAGIYFNPRREPGRRGDPGVRQTRGAGRCAGAAHRRERHDSEAALLAHLRSVADALEEERRRRGAADRRYETLLKPYKDLEKRHDRLLSSKLGTLTVRYWRLRKKLRGLVGPSGGA